jgi:hypothetical protein
VVSLSVVGVGEAKVVARIKVCVGRDGSVSASMEGVLRGIQVTHALMALGKVAAHPSEAVPLDGLAEQEVAN